MSQCLHFSPDKRVRAADALKHPYVAEFHNPDDEPDYPHGAIQVGTTCGARWRCIWQANFATKIQALKYPA